jgi:hypothetical protein
MASHPYVPALVTKHIVGAPEVLMSGRLVMATKFDDNHLLDLMKLYKTKHREALVLSIRPFWTRDNRLFNQEYSSLYPELLVVQEMVNNRLEEKLVLVNELTTHKKTSLSKIPKHFCDVSVLTNEQ